MVDEKGSPDEKVHEAAENETEMNVMNESNALILSRLVEGSKRLKSNARGSVTRALNRLSELMSDRGNLSEVKSSIGELKSRLGELRQAHVSYVSMLTDESEIAREKNRHDEIERDVSKKLLDTDKWILDAERALCDNLSSASSTRSKKAEALTQLAEVNAELQMLDIQRQMNDLNLKMKEQELRLQAEKAKIALQDLDDAIVATQQQDTKSSLVDVKINPPISVTPSALVDHHPSGTLGQLNPPAPIFVSNATNALPASVAAAEARPQFNASPPLVTPAPVQNTRATASHSMAPYFLPRIEMVKFNGDPVEYTNFIRSFEARVMAHTTAAADRLFFLHQSLEDDPKELISSCLYMDGEQGFAEAMHLLKSQYGKPHLICNAFMRKFHQVQSISSDDASALRKLYLLANKCLSSMQALSDMSVIDFPANLQLIVAKLPPYLRDKWKDQVSRHQRMPQFKDLVNFLYYASSAANDPVYGNEALFSSSNPCNANIRKNENKTGRELCVTTNAAEKTECYLCQRDHLLKECADFREMSINEKRAFIREKELCFRCFGKGHIVKNCVVKVTCEKCQRNSHPTLLHDDNYWNESQREITAQSSACRGTELGLHAILPVRVRVGDMCVMTYALYDNGSSASFITDSLCLKFKCIWTRGRSQVDNHAWVHCR